MKREHTPREEVYDTSGVYIGQWLELCGAELTDDARKNIAVFFRAMEVADRYIDNEEDPDKRQTVMNELMAYFTRPSEAFPSAGGALEQLRDFVEKRGYQSA